MDVLSDVLAACRVEGAVTGRFTLSAPWALASAGVDGAMFRVGRGEPWWLAVDGDAPVRVDPGDLVLLPHGSAHIQMSSPDVDVEPIKLAQVLQDTGVADRLHTPLVFASGGGGAITDLFSGIVLFRETHRNPVLRMLPKMIRIREADMSVAPCLGPMTEMFVEESLTCRPGWKITAARMADLLFVHMLRAYLLTHAGPGQDWFRGLSDPKIGKALMLIHNDPRAPWTVESLAEAVFMSRSRFSARFRELVGESPISYLASRRMGIAAERLALGYLRMSDVAEEAGYGSDKVFARAFRRWSGMTPTEYLKSRGVERGGDESGEAG